MKITLYVVGNVVKNPSKVDNDNAIKNALILCKSPRFYDNEDAARAYAFQNEYRNLEAFHAAPSYPVIFALEMNSQADQFVCTKVISGTLHHGWANSTTLSFMYNETDKAFVGNTNLMCTRDNYFGDDNLWENLENELHGNPLRHDFIR